MRNRILEVFFLRASVESVEVTGRFRQVVLRSPGLRDAPWTPGQQVRVDVAPPGALVPVLRTYSVWDHRDDRVELYVHEHGESGPGAAWATALTPGQDVLLSKPKGDFVTRPAPYHLFVGEETASVAFGPMLRALPASAEVYGVVEVAAPEDQLPLPGTVRWLHRGQRSAAGSTELVRAVAGLSLPESPGVAYLAGEARTIQAVRDHLVRERGWPRRSVLTKPFWTPGKRGLE